MGLTSLSRILSGPIYFIDSLKNMDVPTASTCVAALLVWWPKLGGLGDFCTHSCLGGWALAHRLFCT